MPGYDDMPRIIDALVHPHDLKALDNEELGIVAQEIRDQIVQTTSKNGGHLASSLGAVETIVALHAELDCPPDRIVFDVGHQAYAHKILTGRLKQFDTLRQHDGLSGFPNPTESAFDVHPSGHASDSLSVALGLAKARDLRGGSENIVAVIGDASISGGMAFEALNQIGLDQTRMVIVLNDNGMSISPNVGALAHHFGVLRASNAYRDRRDYLLRRMSESGPMARATLAFMNSAKGSVKHLFLPEQTMIFEQLGITCLPPVNGHDIAALRDVLHKALHSHGPTMVHVVTQKGHGYAPAEQTPEAYHGVGPFDVASGMIASAPAGNPTYTDVFGATMLEGAREDSRIVAITAGMEGGTGLTSFAREFPDRFIDVGICEEHALGLASGLATGGCKPFVAIYSTFLQRAIDQAIIDVAITAQNVTICIDRAGLVGEDGVTHQGLFDIALMRSIPNMRMLAPSDGLELESCLRTAFELEGPFAIRYPKGPCPVLEVHDAAQTFEYGKSRTLVDGDDVAILAFGSMVAPSLEASRMLGQQGVKVRVVDMRWVKPLDCDAIVNAAKTGLVVTVEEGVIAGGVGEAVLAELTSRGLSVPTLTLGVHNCFVPHGKRSDLLHQLGLDGEGIAFAIRERLGIDNA